MQSRILHTGVIFGIVFFLLAVGLGYWQVLRAEGLENRGDNPRVAEAARRFNRGSIISADGVVLAETDTERALRIYATPSLSQTVGYANVRFGQTGLELAANDALSGEEGGDFVDLLESTFLPNRAEGNDIVLTIDMRIQEAAVNALGGRKGAIVVIDPRSGAVLALVSEPTYDANTLDDSFEQLRQNTDQPLLNRATQGLYPPGSTFKVVTSAAALDIGAIEPDTTVECNGEYVVQGFPIECTRREGPFSFTEALVASVNAVFAQVANELVGWGAMNDYARRFGIGTDLNFPIDASTSRLHNRGTEESPVLLANTGFGQGELLVTPLQMAIVAATVANGGVRPTPYLISEIRQKNGEVIDRFRPDDAGRVISADTAAKLARMMDEATPGSAIWGKTGTAETPTGGDHSWFIGFGPGENAQYAIAVIVENAGFGSDVARPAAFAIFEALGIG
ncbi:MAG: penicillin-binding transpeptidase domain-containing protein [Dehalococcoidia bacterium]